MSGPSCRSSKGLGSARSALVAGSVRIELMTPCELLDLAWSYPLFEALYGRRSRRFGLGFEMPEGPFRYRSPHTPVPLSEIEEALLVGAGAGFSGLHSGICRRRLRRSTFVAAAAHSRRRGRAATRRFSSPTMQGSTSSMRTSPRASCARSRLQTNGPSYSKRTARSVGSFAVAGSTLPAVYRL